MSQIKVTQDMVNSTLTKFRAVSSCMDDLRLVASNAHSGVTSKSAVIDKLEGVAKSIEELVTGCAWILNNDVPNMEKAFDQIVQSDSDAATAFQGSGGSGFSSGGGGAGSSGSGSGGGFRSGGTGSSSGGGFW